jgi:ABC-type microcin C transport system duplicated ATPase subunit YejF
MANYQPIQTLSWRYSTGTGMLTIVSKITVQVAPGEYIAVTVNSFQNNSVTIKLSLKLAPSDSLTVYINLQNIGTGLIESQIRAKIATIPAKTVIVNFVKNQQVVGTITGTTNETTEVDIIG